MCEVVIHDFSQAENSIVWIAGQVTRRTRGGSMSQIGLAMMAEGDAARDRINYITRTRDGKTLKSSTVALRDAEGHIFGAICINIDITGVKVLEQVLHNFLGHEGAEVVSNIHFGNNVNEVARVVIEEVTQQLGLTSPPADLQPRIDMVRTLDQRGFFGIRNSVPLLADYLSVSRATIYNYLKEINGQSEHSD